MKHVTLSGAFSCTTLIAGAFILVACDISDSEYGDIPQTSTPAESSSIGYEPDIMSADDYKSAISEMYPGFSGSYVDQYGDFVVALTHDATKQDFIESLSRAHEDYSFGVGIDENEKRITDNLIAELISSKIIYNARHDFRLMNNIKEYLFLRMNELNISMIDINESHNRVDVIAGTGSNEIIQIVTDAFETDEDVINVTAGNSEIVFPENNEAMDDQINRNFDTLAGYRIPLEGGRRFVRVNPNGSQYACTITAVGYLGYYPNPLSNGFVTASHCTGSFLRADAAGAYSFYHPTSNGAFLGDEYDDMPIITDSQTGQRYIWGDAASISTSTGINIGYISRTQEPGSILIDSSNPTFGIYDENRIPVENQIYHIMGMSSGWTETSVYRSCVDLLAIGGDPITGGNLIYKCQNLTPHITIFGDSGAPVFGRESNLSDDVHLIGLAWGNARVGGALYGVFSWWVVMRPLIGINTWFNRCYYLNISC